MKTILTIVMALTALASHAADIWDSLLQQYAADSTTRQLLFVKCTEGSNAVVEFYAKPEGENCWVWVRAGKAFIGRNGLGKTREGDKMTPEGDFGIREAFGILPNPGTAIPFIAVTESTYACGDRRFYNQIIDATQKHHKKCNGEHMIEYAPDYNYGISIAYNPQNTPGKGSAIFLHCKGSTPSTAGCVAIDEDFMKQILIASTPSLKICIHPQ